MDSIFGIGIFEFIFILIFALIFLGPERLPKVTKDVLDFIRRLQRLSGDLTRQVNEEIGDLRELDPRYHMDQMMKDEEDEQEKQTASQKEPAPSVQTSAPSQPQPAKATNTAVAGQNSTPKAETISSTPTKSTPQQAVSGTNLSTSANGRQSSAARAQRDAGLSTTAKSKPTTVDTRLASKPQKRGVKSLAELRKQQRAKRQSKTSGTNSSYLAERNKRAQGRAQTRRKVMAAQKIEKEAVADGDESTLVDERSGPEPAEPKAVIIAGQANKEDGESSEETKA